METKKNTRNGGGKWKIGCGCGNSILEWLLGFKLRAALNNGNRTAWRTACQ